MSQKGIIIILVALVVMLTGATVYFATVNKPYNNNASSLKVPSSNLSTQQPFASQSMPQAVPNNQQIASQDNLSAVSTENNIPAGWKLYENKELGISFEYPNKEYDVEQADQVKVYDNEKVEFSYIMMKRKFQSPENKQVLYIYKSDMPMTGVYLVNDLANLSENIINGKKYYKYTIEGMGEIEGYITENNGSYYTFEIIFPDNIHKKNFERIIKTVIFK